jgi:hypothetical protein
MLKKIGIVIANFMKTLKFNELLFIFIVPAIITISAYLFCNAKIIDFNNFANNFNETIITVTSLLASFGLAALSILISSSSANIEKAKTEATKRKDIKNKPISYYKLQVIRNFFALFTQLILLILSLMFKFISEGALAITVYFYMEVFLLNVTIFSQIFVVVSIYYLFVTDKG